MPSHARSAVTGRTLAATAALLLSGGALVATLGTADAASANLLTNPGFESGSLSGWTCSTADSVVSSPVHSGSHALAAAANSSDTAQCSQTVTVSPNTTYDLNGWVQGNYAYIGAVGTGTADTNTWASGSGWTDLDQTITSGATTTQLQVYVHGWYGQGTVHFDDLSLTATGGSTGTPTPTPTPTPTSSPSTSVSPSPSSSSTQPSGAFGRFAPYADLSVWPPYNLASGATTEGTKYFNLAFITDGGTCNPEWGGVTALNDSATVSNIAGLRSAGGDVRVSFGGANGTEIAAKCSSVSALTAAYQNVVTQYQLTHIDFDIEGGAIADTATIDRRNQALAALEKTNPNLKVSYTLPVLPTGLTQDGVNLLTDAKKDGVTLDAVNVMAMDYGSSFSSDMGQDAIDAATATQAQIKSVWTTLTDAQAWSEVAVTPMIGLNDDTSETFTPANATTLVNFAKTKHLAWLSFWSATRDSQCSGGAQNWVDPTCSSIVQTAGQYGQTMTAYTG